VSEISRENSKVYGDECRKIIVKGDSVFEIWGSTDVAPRACVSPSKTKGMPPSRGHRKSADYSQNDECDPLAYNSLLVVDT